MTIQAITLETGAHVVHFYRGEADLVATVGGYLAPALGAGDATVIIATGQHRQALATHLRAAGVDVAEARRAGTWVTIDAVTALERFHRGGHIDADQFRAVIGGAIGQVARRTERTVRCYGEMVALLWDAGSITAAIELEDRWNDLGRELGFSLLCTYPDQLVAGPAHAHARWALGRLHSDVLDTRDGAKRHFAPGRPGAARPPAAFAALSALLDLPPQVHQASGMVSVQLGVDTAQALDRLCSFATTHDKRLDDVAQEVVSRQLRFNDPEAR